MDLPKDLQNIVDEYLEQVPTDKEKHNKRRVMTQIKWIKLFFDNYTVSSITPLNVLRWMNWN